MTVHSLFWQGYSTVDLWHSGVVQQVGMGVDSWAIHGLSISNMAHLTYTQQNERPSDLTKTPNELEVHI